MDIQRAARNTGALIVALFVTLIIVACNGRLADIPDQVPAVVEGAEQNIYAGAGKALAFIVSADELVNAISKVEDIAARQGAVPVAADAAFDKAILEYVRVSDTAVRRIEAGVNSWAELKRVVDPVIAAANHLVSVGTQIVGLQDRLGAFWDALKNIASEALGQLFIGRTA